MRRNLYVTIKGAAAAPDVVIPDDFRMAERIVELNLEVHPCGLIPALLHTTNLAMIMGRAVTCWMRL